MRLVRSTLRGLAAILIVVGAGMLYGCEGIQATDVNNKSFPFADGAVLDSALTGIPMTLTFTNNATLFTLTSAGGLATGTATLSPCVLTVTLSTYPAGTGPQTHEVIPLRACDVERSRNTLTLATATLRSTSGPAAVLSMSGNVEVATALEVSNRLFRFANGGIFHTALTDMLTTLAFTSDATSFTLTSPTLRATDGTSPALATGTATLDPCVFTVVTSTYPDGAGPQADEVIAFSACVFNGNNETLTLANATLSVTGAF